MSESSVSLLDQLEKIVREEGGNGFWSRRPILYRTIVIAICLISIIYLSYTLIQSTRSVGLSKESSQKDPLSKGSKKTETDEIYVDLSGAVNKQGVYKVEANTRLFKLIENAGGLNVDADREFVARNYNLAVPLTDQQKIYIPTIYDVQSGLISENQKIVSTQIDQIQDDSVTFSNSNLTGMGSLISINTDDQSRLMSLPGVGEVTASRIIASRPYETIESIVEKGVVKQTLFDKIKDRLVP